MNYIFGFDGLRGISILLVLITHLGVFHFLPEDDFVRDRLWKLMSGTTGVYIFFSISGFLITRLLILEKVKYGTINLKRFYIRRFLRLTPPLIILFILVSILMYQGLIEYSPLALLISLCYFYNFVPYSLYIPELGHTWSLGVEEQFYLLWPLIVLKFRQNTCLRVAAFIIVGCILAISVIKFFTLTHNGRAYSLEDFFYADRFFIPAVGPIMIGSSVAVIDYFNLFKWTEVFKKKSGCLLGLLLFLSPLYLPAIFLNYVFLFQAVGISFFLAWIFHNQDSLIVKGLEFQPLAFIGKISYGIYVYQGLFLTTGPYGKNSFQKFPLNITLTVVVALASYYLIEKPILKLKKNFTPASVVNVN